MKLPCSLLLSIILLQVARSSQAVTPSGIVSTARRYIGDTRWSFDNSYSSRYGSGTNKCNLFVHDVLTEAGATVPSRHWYAYSPIAAAEWGNPNSSVLRGTGCWQTCASRQEGDIISDGVHVAIVSGGGKTISAASDSVVENNWGYRSSSYGATNSITACWRYRYVSC